MQYKLYANYCYKLKHKYVLARSQDRVYLYTIIDLFYDKKKLSPHLKSF